MSEYPTPTPNPPYPIYNPTNWPQFANAETQLANYVTLSTTQTITGFKTLSAAPKFASGSFQNQNGQSIVIPSNAATLSTTNTNQTITAQNIFTPNTLLANNIASANGNVMFTLSDNRVSLSTSMLALQDNVLAMRGDLNHILSYAGGYGYDGIFVGGYGNDPSGKSRVGGLWTTQGNILSLSWCPDNVSIYAPSPGNVGNILCATFSSNITLAQPTQVTGNVVNCSPSTIVVIQNTQGSVSSTSGALQIAGGAYIGGNSRINRTMTFQGDAANLVLSGSNAIISIANTQSANSITTGALRIAGGLSSNGACYFASTIFQAGGTTANNFSYGYLNSSGATGTGSGVNSYGIISSGRIAASEFNATSSRKIKSIEGNATANANVVSSAIALFKSIPLSKYQYIDQVKNGSDTFYGVIAESMPSWISSPNSQWIPNFYQYGNISMSEEDSNCTIYLDANVRSASDFTNSAYVLAYSGENYNQSQLFQDVSLVNDQTIFAKYYSGNIDGQRMFIYGSNEQVPVVNKLAYLELCATVTRDLLRRVELLEG